MCVYCRLHIIYIRVFGRVSAPAFLCGDPSLVWLFGAHLTGHCPRFRQRCLRLSGPAQSPLRPARGADGSVGRLPPCRPVRSGQLLPVPGPGAVFCFHGSNGVVGGVSMCLVARRSCGVVSSVGLCCVLC